MTSSLTPLADLLVAEGNFLPLHCERFSLDDAAIDLVRDLSGCNVRTLLERIFLARLPFDKLWIEYEFKHRKINPDVDAQVGYYLHRMRPDDPCEWSIRAYQKDKGFSLLEWPWTGIIYTEKFSGPITHIAGSADAPHGYGVDNHIFWGYGEKTRGVQQLLEFGFAESSRKEAAVELAGLPRFVCTILALINDGPISIEKSTPSGKFWTKRGQRPYMATNTIRLKIPTRVRYIAQYASKYLSAAKKRRHQVKGHWRNYEGGKKVWIREHLRGDASLGFVNHTYSVGT